MTTSACASCSSRPTDRPSSTSADARDVGRRTPGQVRTSAGGAMAPGAPAQPLQTRLRLRERRLPHRAAVASRPLRRVEGDVGSAEQLVGSVVRAQPRAHTEACRDQVGARRGVHRLTQPLGHHQRSVLVGLVQQHGELVAAQPADDVGAPRGLAQHGGQRTQGAVPGVVAAGVVERLEVVHVGHDRR